MTKNNNFYLKKAKLVHNSKQLGTNTIGYGLWSVTFFFPILRFDEADLFASNLGREPSYIEKAGVNPFILTPLLNLNNKKLQNE
jgi:hypothetical protein